MSELIAKPNQVSGDEDDEEFQEGMGGADDETAA
jgi:hypothetical protein